MSWVQIEKIMDWMDPPCVKCSRCEKIVNGFDDCYYAVKIPSKMFRCKGYDTKSAFIEDFGKGKDGKKLLMNYLERFDQDLLEKLFKGDLVEA